jgi:HK97 family phage portal protein
MGLLRRAWTPSSLDKPERWLVDGYGGPETAAGVQVSEETALYYSPFFASVNVVANDVAALPLPLYRKDGRGKTRAQNHPLYALLHDAPNPLMSSLAFRRTLQGHAMTWGTGFAYTQSNGAGDVTALWPLHPGKVWPEKVARGRGQFDLWWRYIDPDLGIETLLRPDQVMTVAGLGGDGITGYSIVQLARNAIGLGLAAEVYGAKFFGNSAHPSGVLRKKEGKLSTEARTRLKADWENMHRGLDAAQRVAILEEGLEWQTIGVPPADAQFLETRKLQVSELARWHRVPPHKIGDLEKATYSNIESQQLDYVSSTLMSWLVTWEQSIKLTLLTPSERAAGYFAEHITAALLRGDTKSRFEAYGIGRQWGWLSANDIREKENENPVADGDLYLIPMNMVPASQATAPAPSEVQQAKKFLEGTRIIRTGAMRRPIPETYRPLIIAADERGAKLEEAEVASLARKHLSERARRTGRDVDSFIDAVRVLYAELVPDRANKAWLPVFTEFAAEVAADAAADVAETATPSLDTWVAAYVASHVAYNTASAVAQIVEAAAQASAEGLDVAEAVLALLAHWVATRPERIAKWECNQLLNAAAREAWRAAGVAELRWNAHGETCGFCTGLDGAVSAIDRTFAAAGTEMTAEGESSPLRIEHDMYHPPIHPGCDCTVEPV